MRKTIFALSAAAFIASGMVATTPAFAAAKKPAQPAAHPLPALGVLPAMLILDTKKNPKFKPVKPYGKKTRTSL